MLRRERETYLPCFVVIAYIVVPPSQHTRCPREITGCPTRMTRFVLVPRLMLTGIATLTGVSVSLYAVSGLSPRGTIGEIEIRHIPRTTTIQRNRFTGGTPSRQNDTPVGLPCQLNSLRF
jgi:hypothetical protein